MTSSSSGTWYCHVHHSAGDGVRISSLDIFKPTKTATAHNLVGVAGGVDGGEGTASVGSSPIQSGTVTNTAYVGCIEGGGGHLVGLDNPYFCCCSSCGSEVVTWADLLLVGGNTTLVARPYDWREWDRGSPIFNDGGTNFRKKRLFLNDRRPEPYTFTQDWS